MVEDLRKYTRRDVLKIGAAIGGGILLTQPTIDRLVIPIAEQHQAWEEANVSNEEFLEKNESKLSHITIGASFSPEQVWYLNGGARQEKKSKAVLKYVVEEIPIRNLRIGIRWSHAMPKKGLIDLKDYSASVDYCLETDVELVKGVGPEKTFRYPEQHIPFFLKKSGLPKKNAVITLDMEIAKEAMEYQNLLFHQLDLQYGADLRKKVDVIQIQNEPFINFGEYGWTMSEDYLENLVTIAQPYFPQSKFLFNSGPFKVQPVSSLFDRLANKGIKLVYGTDFYTNMDDNTNPYNWLHQSPLIRDLDLVTLAKIAGRPIQPTTKAAFETEITEAQFEGWGRYVQPGNSARHLRYLLLRCMNNILDMEAGQNYVIRLWGIEAFAQKMMSGTGTKEHDEILKLIQAINCCLN